MVNSKAYERLKRKMTVENLWLYVIKVLKDVGELRAYDIKKELIKRFEIKPATITVYAVIYKMVRDELIESVSSPDGTRYRVTKKGLETFDQGITYIDRLIKILSS